MISAPVVQVCTAVVVLVELCNIIVISAVIWAFYARIHVYTNFCMTQQVLFYIYNITRLYLTILCVRSYNNVTHFYIIHDTFTSFSVSVYLV